jgi:FkbM family methyltransferase
MSRLAGNNGHVYAIEPMTKFFNTLKGLVSNIKAGNITLYQYAMGGGMDLVEMGIPRVNNVKKFAYARVIRTSTFLEYVESEKVKNISGDELFRDLPRADFIKCDVEGLELAVFQSFIEIIDKHYPVILCELGDPQERKRLLDLFSPFNYKMYYLENKKLKSFLPESPVAPVSHNHYFIPERRLQNLSHLIS